MKFACLLFTPGREAAVRKYGSEIKTRGREGRIRTKGYKRKNNTEERLKTDEDPYHLKSNLYHCFRMRQSNWGNKQ